MEVKDIKPEHIYNTSVLSDTRYQNGDLALCDICKAKKEGLLPYYKKGPAHLMLGSDIIAFLNKKYNLIRTKEDAANDLLKSIPNKELLRIILQNKKLLDENKKCLSLVKSMSNKNEQLEKEMVLYKDRKDKETKRTKLVTDHIENIIFNNKHINRIDRELVLACGIYFLIKENNIVYVGQSVNIPGRVLQHIHDGKDFDDVRFIKCEKKDLDAKEMFFIRLLKPKLNGDYKNRDHYNIYKVTLNTT